jgi:predicted permease
MRQALRQLTRDRGLTALVCLTIALGVGVNTALFSLVNGLHRPLPVRNAARLYVLATRRAGAPSGSGSEGMEYRFTYPALADFQAQSRSWAGLLAFQFGQGGIGDGRRPRHFFFSYVSGNYFSVLGIPPAAGRLFTPGEGESPDAPLEIVLSYSYWQKLYGGDPSVIGRQVRINGAPATIIGVAARGFHGTYANTEMDAFVPLSLLSHTERFGGAGLFHDRASPRLTVMGILAPGVAIAQARSEAVLIAARLEHQYPATDQGISVWIIPETWARPVPIPSMVSSGPFIAGLFLLLGALVLVLACMNVGNVLLVRAAAREREMAVRAALGSGRARLVRQVLAESLLLAACGGIAGILLGSWASAALGAIPMGNEIPAALDLSFDWRVFAYALAATLLAGIGAGLWPALAASRADISTVLHESGRSGTAARGSRRFRNALVIVQVAGSLTLLIVAGLFARGLSSIRRMDLGFDPRHLAALTTDTAYAGYDTPRATAFYRDLERRVRDLPGVDSAALSFSAPVDYSRVADNVAVEGRAPAPVRDLPLIFFNAVTPDYFRTLSMPLLRGRAFLDTDRDSAPRVAIVNETMARNLWPNQDPTGKRFRLARAGDPWWEVVGVARDSKYLTLFEPPLPFFYVPAAQQFYARRTLQARSGAPPETLLPRLEAEIRTLDPDMPVTESRTMEQALDGMSGFWGFRLGAYLTGAMGAVGLILAVVGVYGVVSYAAGARTREIGIRMALGAGSREVLRLIVGQGVALVGTGIVLGLALAAVVGRAMSRGLHGAIEAAPMPFLIVTVILAAVALLGSYIPARRAIRLDPTRALHHE